jgi:hypothetical protein
LASTIAGGGSSKQADAIRRSLFHTYHGIFFAIAALFPGHDHWQLDENEAATLAELTDRALANVKKGKTAKKILTYLPVLALVTTGGGLIGARIQESYAKTRARKAAGGFARGEGGPGARAASRDAARGGAPEGGDGAPGSRNPSSASGSYLRALASEPFA